MQEIVVALLGLVAVIYLGRKIYHTFKGKQECSCKGSCDSCTDCREAQHKSEK